MGITRVKDDLLKDLKIDDNLDFGAVKGEIQLNRVQKVYHMVQVKELIGKLHWNRR